MVNNIVRHIAKNCTELTAGEGAVSKLRSKAQTQGKKPKVWKPAALPRELLRLSSGWWRHASIGIPFHLVRSAVKDASFVSWSDKRVYAIIGDALLNVVDDWGPLYGKAMQMWFARLGPKGQVLVEKLNLDRVYGDWPSLPWADVQKLLDRETPHWRDRLIVESVPLGVASMSQVHGAVDHNGKRWVIKFLKPKATSRLEETIAALETAMTVADPFAVTLLAKRLLKDMRDLCDGLRREMDLGHESKTMRRVRDRVEQRRSKAICVPDTLDELGTKRVIVMERLDGVKLSDVIAGRAELTQAARRSLAKKVLGELLVQIFEWGLFHADPHAGNLMLLEDGSVGLYDWGLAGELLESDRHYIAGILRAVMTLDLERLIDVLQKMGADTRGIVIDRERIRKELHKISEMVKASEKQGGKTPSLHALIEAALEAAERLGIAMPNGLLLMAKSLLTIEGLARGIDEDVSFGRVAGPVLFRAASPDLADVLGLVKQLPRLAGKWLRK